MLGRYYVYRSWAFRYFGKIKLYNILSFLASSKNSVVLQCERDVFKDLNGIWDINGVDSLKGSNINDNELIFLIESNAVSIPSLIVVVDDLLIS